ncbi:MULTISPECIES: glutamate-5-semialdehyde dehydrogenase [Maribacter]|uniref:Gamma-glutamyl phosphate reductase n=1 Tax=Maribacter flavus TaxID=1658664 RepID=A0ABU7IFN6_9FLAO|nr:MULTISPECIES: glutamate-5-semialdehyde dehydrogenase [Maribacter]MDC6404624.1 glutamate-5-semialdehyde dehydrogenase [Maribacter sp. PR66]MEE1971767.1 glutamate-5-semialdehyde dehydrogenase [Maribacter flavus]
MNKQLDITTRNAVLTTMAQLISMEKSALLAANKLDLDNYDGADLAMGDRLKVDDAKVAGMISALKKLASEPDPLGIERFAFSHENGIKVSNRTAPFGTILIIYESRPDVTIEAAGIAFKSGNKILLKGGKESLNSNLFLVELWHKALEEHECPKDWVTYLEFDRTQTQAFLEHPTQKLDLIVPRGGEKLIAFVKQHARCPVIVSGRGNNFVYVDTDADLQMALDIIINGKASKISACNALDKVLISRDLPRKQEFLHHLIQSLKKHKVEILTDAKLEGLEGTSVMPNEKVWYEEFLDYKILIGQVPDLDEAIITINTYGGGHSAVIVTNNEEKAAEFLNSVDAAAVYHNASSRFTDGSEFGLGGELAISTDKLHQRGPIGLQHLVTNKWYVKGNGQIR